MKCNSLCFVSIYDLKVEKTLEVIKRIVMKISLPQLLDQRKTFVVEDNIYNIVGVKIVERILLNTF